MAPLGLSWSVFLLYLSGTIGVIVLSEALLASRKIKAVLQYYFSWNDTSNEPSEKTESTTSNAH